MHCALPAALIKHGQPLADLLNEIKDDFSGLWTVPKSENITGPYAIGNCTDEWGVGWQNDYHGMLGIPVVHPLGDWEKWKGYKLPPGPDDQWYANMKKHIEDSGHEKYVNLGGINLFERMQWIRGYDNLMVDIALDADEAYLLRDAIVEREMDYLQKAVHVGADGFHFGDDWGTQIALIISPDTWRKFYKPAYTRMFQVCKAAGKHVHFHSDGVTWAILADLIDAGVDVLNVQHTIMDLKAIAREFGGKIAFRSDLDRQHILPHGTRDQIRAHVKEVFEALGSYNGGLIGHGEIAVDVPVENARAMLEAWREFGQYAS